MKAVEFCYWLQGYFEINGSPTGLSQEQTDMVKRHLALVFKHEIDPSYGMDQVEAQEIHDGKKPKKPKKPTFGGVGPNGEIYRC